jgi:ABC-type ATPase with predicted acetyltransferase domain
MRKKEIGVLIVKCYKCGQVIKGRTNLRVNPVCLDCKMKRIRERTKRVQKESCILSE